MSDAVEFNKSFIGKTLNYKGLEFKVMLFKNQFHAVVNFVVVS